MIYHDDGTEVNGPPTHYPLGSIRKGTKGNPKIGYLGNPKIKRSNIKMRMSPQETQEFIKCASDPIYFMRAYMKIVNVDGGLIQFDMYDFQEDMIKVIHDNRFSSVCCARQVGKTITITGYLLWFVLFNSYKNVGILANKKKNSVKALARLKLAYEKLPMWLQQGVVSWNKGDIELENGSIIAAYAASSDAARGESFSFLFVDEVAFIPSTVWDEYYKSSYPTISSGKTSKIALVSTPNGLNHFYSIHNGARKGKNTYKPFEVRWDMVPGRDAAWKKETIANTSEEDFLQEHEIEFLGNSSTLIPGSTLRNLVVEEIISLTESMTVIENPIIDHNYFLTVDVSHGIGGDHSTISVIDITEYPYKQVAIFRDNKVSSLVFPNIIESIGTSYNRAYILIETNDVGVQVAQTLNWDFEYENLISCKEAGAPRSKLGIRVNKKTKKIGCNRLKDMIVSEKLQITTEETINELYAFQEHGDSYEAEYGHDDIVMGLVNFSYYVSTPSFALICNTAKFSKTYAEQFQKQALETLTPLPRIDTGISEAEAFYEEHGYIDGSHDKGFMA